MAREVAAVSYPTTTHWISPRSHLASAPASVPALNVDERLVALEPCKRAPWPNMPHIWGAGDRPTCLQCGAEGWRP